MAIEIAKHNSKSKTIGLIAALLLLTAGLFVLFWRLELAEANRVPDGVFIEGINISNMDKHLAADKIRQMESNLLTKQIQLSYNNQKWSLQVERLGITVDAEGTVKKALERDGSAVIGRIVYYFNPVPKELEPSLTVDREKVEAILKPIIKEIEQPAKDSVLVINEDGTVNITPDKKGIKVNLDQLINDLVLSINQKGNTQVDIHVEEVEAHKTAENIKAMRINGVIGEFTTYFDGENIDRVTNIKIAAGKINGMILAPEQEFSFNNSVGQRTSSAGYRPALVILGNKFEEALGGGICQVSSTLYNAILLAALNPVERHNHSLAISYVPLGRDAAVAWNLLDFKFVNNLNCHIYLRTVVGKNYIKVQIFGDTTDKQEVIVRSWVTETFEPKHIFEVDASLLPGEEVLMEPGYRGFKARAQRVIKQKGEILRTEELSPSYYYPQARVTRVAPSVNGTDVKIGETSRKQEVNEPRIVTEF